MKKHWKIVIPLIFIATALVLNAVGWLSPAFCEFYVLHIFPLWVGTYGRFTGLFPFSVGEWMLYLGVLLIILYVLWGAVMLIVHRRLSHRGKKLFHGYGTVLLWIFGIVCIIMNLNCFLLYHVPTLKDRYGIGAGKEYEFGEIALVRDYVVEQANHLSEMMARDEQGYLVYEGDMKAEAVRQMRRLGDSFSQLQGYYPYPKPLYTSDFFSQQYIMGYYFPFSLEANYNNRMYISNWPASMCHELSHLKGFILEDEANFIGYLACVDSEDAFFRYSAYLSVISYLDRDFYRASGNSDEVYQSHPAISDLVRFDRVFLTKQQWQQVEEHALISTEIVQEASNTFTEKTLTLNGVSDGKISYSRVVDLLLGYYDGILY